MAGFCRLPLLALTGRIGVMLAVGMFAGCQTSPERIEVEGKIQQALDEGVRSQPAPPAPPKAVGDALLPAIGVDAGPLVRELEERFEISVSEVPARQFFMSLVDGTPHNMVVHPEVSGNITLNLKKVSIPEVMDIMHSVYGYEFERTRFGFEVLPARLRSQVFQVNFLNMIRTGNSQIRVSSGQVSESSTTSDGTTSESSTVSGAGINTTQTDENFWTDLERSINAILGGAPGRSAVVNRQSGTILVRGMPLELREVGKFLDQTQAVVQRQVILEAKIIEVELFDGYQQGVNWGALVNVNGNPATVGQIGGGTIVDSGAKAADSLISGNVGDLNPAALAPIIGTAASAFGGMFTVALALGDFAAFIELLETQGTVHVLSSPRISTMNNQKAIIKVGTDEFFVTDVSSTTTTGTTTTTTPDIDLTPFFSGIALDVTPQISEDGDVTLHVHPTISSVEDQQKTITVGSVTQTLPLARSTVRESDSVVRAKSGQVIVIGGLMQNIIDDGISEYPGLSDIPGLSSIFSHKRKRSRKTEVVILLKPVVVQSGQDWAYDMRRSADRFRGISNTVQQREDYRNRNTFPANGD